jgi:hypothetical protein
MKFCDCGSLVIDGKCTNKKCLKEFYEPSQFEMQTFEMLDYINNPPNNCINLIKKFDGAIPFCKGKQISQVNESFETEKNLVELFKKLDSNFDFKVISDETIGYSHVSTDNYLLQRLRWANPKETRGRIKRFSTNILCHEIVFLNDNPQYVKAFYVLHADYFELLNNNLSPNAWMEEVIWALANIALFNNKHWNVYLKDIDDVIGIKIQIYPTSLKELFKLRNIPQGKNRKLALKHWVSEHSKRKPNATTNEDLIFINKYLRGATEFNWNGLYCKVIPSIDDLKTLECLKIRSEGI